MCNSCLLIIWCSYQCNQVPGVLTAEVSTTAEDNQSHKEDGIGHVVCPWITSHKELGIIDKGEDGNKGESDQQLHCENQEDLVEKRWCCTLMWLTVYSIIYFIYLTQRKTYFSDEGLSDSLVLKARVGELLIVVVRWRPVTMVTRAACRCWRTTRTGRQLRVKKTTDKN